jgi:uncharacterized paraquat-inducible protein A
MGNLLPFRRPPPEDPDEPMAPCSHCGKPVDQAAIRCRSCGKSTLPSRSNSLGLPWWLLLGIVLAALALVGWLSGR